MRQRKPLSLVAAWSSLSAPFKSCSWCLSKAVLLRGVEYFVSRLLPLCFGGTLSRDAQVNIETGLSGVEVAVPASTVARIVAETTLGSVEVGDGFAKKEDAFLTTGAMGEVAPVLTIRAGVSLWSLRLPARRGRAHT